ncbi:hypothetical protein R1flu_009552 [Riccia fluitans]|uniref:Uncharacterized protein n=1 Tax=Riccia fluitans TaxID=41844 RepID=A0ABD1Z2M8_9MARC
MWGPPSSQTLLVELAHTFSIGSESDSIETNSVLGRGELCWDLPDGGGLWYQYVHFRVQPCLLVPPLGLSCRL